MMTSASSSSVKLWDYSNRVTTGGPNNDGLWLNDAGGLSTYYTSEVYVSGSMRHNITGSIGYYNYELLTETELANLIGGGNLYGINWGNHFSGYDPQVPTNDLYFTGEELFGYKYLILITWDDRSNNTVVSDYFIELNPIQFVFNVLKCVDNKFEFTLRSSLTNAEPALGNVTIIGTNMDECSKDVITEAQYSTEYQMNTVSFNKALCQIEYESQFKVVYSYDWLVTELNTQIFNAQCKQDFTSIHLQTDVDNINIVIDEVQEIFDHALATEMLVLSNPTDVTSVVTSQDLGATVHLYIALPSAFRSDFDITVKDCWADNEKVLEDGMPLAETLFREFNETLRGVAYNEVILFKSLDHIDTRDILFSCVVQTCIDECHSVEGGEGSGEGSGEGGSYRRRRSANSQPTSQPLNKTYLLRRLRAHRRIFLRHLI